MEIKDIFSLVGGLALFLHGMQMMSSGLEAAAGSQMKSILERLTSNRFLAVLVGALITTAVQSSSATTVMVVGFVNAGMMTLGQAVWLIMGANVGKTTTGLLIALDVGALAPLAAFIGVALMVFTKKAKLQHIGQLLAGLGILFVGMDMMSGAMEPLREIPTFLTLMSTLSNPVLGILVGALFTALIQSSAASVGILQTLAAAGVVQLSGAVYVLFGQNIGTCITAIMASFGTSRDAKRATCVHLLFNVIGTVLFTVIVMVTPLTAVIEAAVPSPMTQIALMHVLFNLVTAALLLPLGGQLVKLTTLILPNRPDEERKDEMRLVYLTSVGGKGKEGGLGVSAIVIDQLRHELRRMLSMAQENVAGSFQAVLSRDVSRLEELEKRENYIDFLNREISRYVSQLIAVETNELSSEMVSSFFTITGNIERIGDHADNLAGYTRLLAEKEISFSQEGMEEIETMQTASLEAIDALLSQRAGSGLWLEEVSQMEQSIDDLTDEFRRDQLERMRTGSCNEEACILFSELLTDFERIGDHVLNIAEELAKSHTSL